MLYSLYENNLVDLFYKVAGMEKDEVILKMLLERFQTMVVRLINMNRDEVLSNLRSH
jgi:hypothetical protein